MKTPDEVKQVLRHCAADKGCKGCLLGEDNWSSDCIGRAMAEALAYIEQLEAERVELIKAADRWGELCRICKHREMEELHKTLCLVHEGDCEECNFSRLCRCKDCANGGYEWDGETVRK